MMTAEAFISDYVKLWCGCINIIASGMVEFSEEVIDKERDITAFVARFPNGNRIVSLSSKPEAFAGKGGDILLDELDLHERPDRLLAMAIPCKNWGGQLEVVSAYSPFGGPTTTFAKLCMDVKTGKRLGVKFFTTNIYQACEQRLVDSVNMVCRAKDQNFTDYTQQTYIEELKRDCLNDNMFNTQYMCLSANSGDIMIAEYLYKEAYTIQPPVLGFSSVLGGADIGRNNDNASFVALNNGENVYGNNTFSVKDIEIWNNQRYDFMLDRFEKFCNRNEINTICVDRTGIGDMFAEYAVTRMENTRTNVVPVFITHDIRQDILGGMMKGFKEHMFSIDEKTDTLKSAIMAYRLMKSGLSLRYDAPHNLDEGLAHADEAFAFGLAVYARGTTDSPIVVRKKKKL